MATMLVGLDDEDDEDELVRFWFARRGQECLVGEIWEDLDAVRARFVRRFHHTPYEVFAVTLFDYHTGEYCGYVAWEAEHTTCEE